ATGVDAIAAARELEPIVIIPLTVLYVCVLVGLVSLALNIRLFLRAFRERARLKTRSQFSLQIPVEGESTESMDKPHSYGRVDDHRHLGLCKFSFWHISIICRPYKCRRANLGCNSNDHRSYAICWDSISANSARADGIDCKC